MRLLEEIKLSLGPLQGFVAVGLCWGAFAAQVPAIKSNIGASDGVFGVLLLIGSVAACVSMLCAPVLARMMGAWRLIAPMLGMALMGVFLGMPSSTLGFALVLICMTASSGALDVIMNTELSGVEARENTGLMGLNHAVFSFTYAICAVVSGLAREAGFGPEPIFAAVLLVCLVMAKGMGQGALPRQDDESRALRLPWGLVALVGAIMMIGVFAEISVEHWSALYLERDLGGSAAAGAMGPALLGFTMGIGRLFSQVLTRGMSEVKVISLAGFLSAVGMALVAMADSIWAAYPGFILFGLGVSVAFPMGLAIAGKAVDDARRSRMISRVAFLGYIGFFAGPPVIGIVAEGFGLHTSFALVAVLLLVMAGPLCWLLARPRF